MEIKKKKKQPTVSRSSAEAEYQSLACATSELLWLKSLLTHFEINIIAAMIFCDNQVAIHLASNPSFHERSKHIEIDFHFIRKHGFIKLVHVKTTNQLADLLTKPVSSPQFHSLFSKFGALDIYAPTGSIRVKLS